MKNIAVFAALVIIVLLYAPPAAAQRSYALSIASQFGLFYGQTEEIVFPPPAGFPQKTDKDLLSQLLWDMKPVLYYGVAFDFSRVDPLERLGFFSTVSLKTAIPGKSGKIEDRDWLSTVDNALTHYSSHTNRTNRLFWLDVMAGVSIPIQSRFLLKTYVSVPYMNFYFSGTDGYGTYARKKPDGTYYPIDDAPSNITFTEKVINYTQEWLTVAPGVSFSAGFLGTFFFDVSFQISPVIFCADFDEHLRTDTEYRDYMRGGVFLEPRAAVSFAATKWMSLSLAYSWRYISGTRGETYMKGNGSDRFERAGKAGTGLSVMDTGLTLRIRF